MAEEQHSGGLVLPWGDGQNGVCPLHVFACFRPGTGENHLSTVLWANVLIDGKVKSDQTDHFALYKHANRLDSLALSLQLPSFHEICDTTDLRVNTEVLDLPQGMMSTDELMAAQGAWMAISVAISFLQALRDHIAVNNIRFGLLRNQQQQVLQELDEVIAFAVAEAPQAQMFNFSVVM